MSTLCSVMFSFLYLPILLMLFKCILMCECIWLLSLSVVCLFFDALYFRAFLVFFNFSNVLQVYLNLRVYLFVFVFVVEVLFSFFCICSRNFFSLAVSSGNLLAGDVHSSVTMDRQHLLTHLRPTLGICSLEACSRILGFLLLIKCNQEGLRGLIRLL